MTKRVAWAWWEDLERETQRQQRDPGLHHVLHVPVPLPIIVPFCAAGYDGIPR
jgi:hypothetical protein